MNLSILLIFAVVEGLLNIITALKLVKIKLRPNILRIILFLAVILVNSRLLFRFKVPQYINTVEIMILSIISFRLIFKVRLKKSILILLMAFIITSLIQVLSISVMGMVFKNMDKTPFYGVISLSISFIALLVVLRRIENINIIFEELSLNKILLMAITYFLLYITIIYWHSNHKLVIDNSLLMTIICVLVIVYFKTMSEQIRINERNKITKELYNMTSKFVDDVKASNHEVSNHLQTIKSFLETNGSEVEKKIDYIDGINDKLKLNNIIKLEDHLLMALLYNKLKEAEEKNIDFRLMINKVDSIDGLTEYEVLEIVATLLDNAFEACDEKNNIVYFKLYSKKNVDVIEVWNSYPKVDIDDIEKFFKKGFTTKDRDSNSGIGLYNIEKILRKKELDIIVENTTLDGVNYIRFVIYID